MNTKEFAAIDLGSNTAKLSIYRYRLGSTEAHLMCESDASHRLRLAELQDYQRNFPPHAIQMVIDTVGQFVRYCESAHVSLQNVDAVATNAVRTAANQADVIAQIAAATGVHVRVLSEAEEAALAVAGVMHRMPIVDGIVFDHGGGGLQIAAVKGGVVTDSRTYQLGTLRLRQRFPMTAPVDRAQFSALRQFLAQRLSDAPTPRAGQSSAAGNRHRRRVANAGPN